MAETYFSRLHNQEVTLVCAKCSSELEENPRDAEELVCVKCGTIHPNPKYVSRIVKRSGISLLRDLFGD